MEMAATRVGSESGADSTVSKTVLRRTGTDPGVARGHGLERVDAGLRPALFAHYRNLARLRHDYPLVLARDVAGATSVRSLSSMIDEILRAIAPPGPGGERLRRHVLDLEDRMRALVAGGATGLLSAIWGQAETSLLAEAREAARVALGEDLKHARGALNGDGEILDCGAATPAKLLVHLWNAAQAAKANTFQEKTERLIRRLSDMLRADFMKSEEARRPEVLKAAFGTAYEAVFDFTAMSGLLARTAGIDRLPADRRRRVDSALAVLESQRFYARGGVEPYVFVFESVAAASEAFRARLPAMVEVVKAIGVAELEIENRYRTVAHDPFFARLDAGALRRGEMALFPSYLVCLREKSRDPAETGRALEILGTDLPIKLLLQTDDILADSALRPGQPSFGAAGGPLAAMAAGLSNAYVLQAPASHLYRLRERLVKGLEYEGPALFSVFSGAAGSAAGVPPYLLAAAALESRAFPAFVYDPAAGPDLASRLNIDDNPQVDADWPIHRIAYEDEEHQRVAEDTAFTFVDFAACDGRHAGRCVSVPRGEWAEDMIAVHEYLTREGEKGPAGTPYILMVDGANVLRRIVVDDALVQAARRCRAMWRSLQELGGINNSHARKLLDRARQAWEEEKEQALAALRGQVGEAPIRPAVTEPAASEKAAAAGDAEKPAPSSDEPYIETPRCTTCDECIQINDRMFAYDGNKQAYIKDVKAGTYRELVEAAESCQVSIIHPGKPWNPAEPNLDELIERAKPFN